MIENKALAREAPYELGGYRKVFAVNQDVVGKIELFQRGYAAQKIRLQQESIVGLTLHDVANADQPRLSSQDLQLRPNVRRPQINPADHPENPRRILSQLYEPVSFFQRLSGLDRNR